MLLLNFGEQLWTFSRYIASGLSFRQITFTSDAAGGEIYQNNKHYSNQIGIFFLFSKTKFSVREASGLLSTWKYCLLLLLCTLQVVRDLNTKHTQCGTWSSMHSCFNYPEDQETGRSSTNATLPLCRASQVSFPLSYMRTVQNLLGQITQAQYVPVKILLNFICMARTPCCINRTPESSHFSPSIPYTILRNYGSVALAYCLVSLQLM